MGQHGIPSLQALVNRYGRPVAIRDNRIVGRWYRFEGELSVSVGSRGLGADRNRPARERPTCRDIDERPDNGLGPRRSTRVAGHDAHSSGGRGSTFLRDGSAPGGERRHGYRLPASGSAPGGRDPSGAAKYRADGQRITV